MAYYKKLQGENIYLSPLCADDSGKYVRWFTDFSLTDGLGNSAMLVNDQEESKWLSGELSKSSYTFAIVENGTDMLLGNCALGQFDGIHQTAVLGIFIGEESKRSQGYGAQAINLLLDYGFNYLNLHSVSLDVMSFNKRAISCYEKVGFKRSGCQRESYYLNGKFYDQIIMDILRNEFSGDFIKNKVIR